MVFIISQHFSKLKKFFSPVNHLKAHQYTVKFMICVALDIEKQSSCTEEPPILDDVNKVDHYIIIVLTITVVNRNINFRHIMVITV